MSEPVIDCEDVVGKTVHSLKIYPDSDGASEAILEFTDGTAFSLSVVNELRVKGLLYREGIGTLEVLKEYEP